MPGQKYNFTMDKKLIEALSDKEKVRLLCIFMSHTGDYQFDYAVAAQREGIQANSMNTLASQSMKKIKVDGGAPSPAAKQSGGRGAGSGKAKGTSARKRKTSSEDDNEVPVTPTKKPESSKKAKKEDSAEVDDGIESEVLGANGGASGFEAYGINLGAYGVGTDLDYDF